MDDEPGSRDESLTRTWTGCLPQPGSGFGKEDLTMLLMQMGLMFGFLVVFVTVGFAKQPLTVR